MELGETLDVEFKGEQNRQLGDRELIETVVCMANRGSEQPGYLLVGVEDDGTVTGARPRHPGGKTEPIQVQALITNNTQPALSCQGVVIELDEKPILVIEIPPSRVPVGTSDGRYVHRVIGGKGSPECKPLHFHEMQALQAHRQVLDYSALPVEQATWEDLDPIEFDRYRRSIRESRAGGNALLDLPDLELAKALGAVVANHNITEVRVLALLLFGKEEALSRLLPTHEVAYQVIEGVGVRVNEFYRWPLLRVVDEILTRFRATNREDELMMGLLRIGVPDYPERAFREGLANALIHRDYTRLGAVHVQWQSDRIEISNPGGFPEGVNLGNLLVTPPRPRNPLLADAFKRAGIVERIARGISTIFYEQLRNGRPAPSFENSTDTDVILALPGGEANLEFVKLVVEENQAERLLTVEELLLLNCLWQERSISTGRASHVIQRSEAEARAVLQRLVESGLAEARGDGKGRSYHLSAKTYQRLGEKAAYVRQRGFEPLQQEQMILQYAKKHGKITRREAAELCKISSPQARSLLGKLKGKGELVLRGKKRGSYYEPATKIMDKSKTDMDKSKKSKREPK
jgi:ATP-dependent DNA helicase RecG